MKVALVSRVISRRPANLAVRSYLMMFWYLWIASILTNINIRISLLNIFDGVISCEKTDALQFFDLC